MAAASARRPPRRLAKAFTRGWKEPASTAAKRSALAIGYSSSARSATATTASPITAARVMLLLTVPSAGRVAPPPRRLGLELALEVAAPHLGRPGLDEAHDQEQAADADIQEVVREQRGGVEAGAVRQEFPQEARGHHAQHAKSGVAHAEHRAQRAHQAGRA